MKKTKNETNRRTAATLPIASLKGAEWNTHRTANGEDEAFEGLMASIRANGLIQRVAVMAAADAAAAEPYRIIDGHRRVEAVAALGWNGVPCEIIEGLTDAEAQAMTLTANIQRLENDPLLEADCIERLRGDGKTYEQIAAILGKTARYVARRARLCALTPEWRDWFGRQEGVTADLMEFVAAHEPGLQYEVYRSFICEEDGTVDEDAEIDEGAIERAFKDCLRRIDDETAFDTTPCATCPNNTATHGWLFPPEEDGDCNGRCEKAACYVAKWNAAVDAKIEALRRKHVTVREAKQKWDVPNYWSSTAARTKTNTAPWIYEEHDLRRILWVEPSDEGDPAKTAKTEAEKTAERELKARIRAWQDKRDKVRSTFVTTNAALLRAAVLRATDTQRFRDWGVAALAEPDFWGPAAIRGIVDVVGRDEIKKIMPLNDEELDAVYAERPEAGDAAGEEA